MEEPNFGQEINKYRKFKKVDGATYRKVNQFLRRRTYITAREWALARLCTDFRTSGGAEMTFIGKHLPELVPFMEDTYSPQAVNQARSSFKKKVRKSSATFFYGAMCGFFTTDELDDLLFEASEVARFLLEVEGTTLDIDEEIDIEDRITKVMRSVGEAAKTILKTRGEEMAENIPLPKGTGNMAEDNGDPDENASAGSTDIDNSGSDVPDVPVLPPYVDGDQAATPDSLPIPIDAAEIVSSAGLPENGGNREIIPINREFVNSNGHRVPALSESTERDSATESESKERHKGKTSVTIDPAETTAP